MIEKARDLIIIVDNTNKEFHTKDWGLYIQNFDCVGDPIQHTNYIQVPYSDKQIDMSEALSGRPTYISRPITIQLAGKGTKYGWDAVLSAHRNEIEGRVCRVIFSNDPAYYWKGRVHLTEFRSETGIGFFTLSIPEAEPYKYSIHQSTDRWEWDTFSFETGVITNSGYVDINGTTTIKYPAGHMEIAPIFDVKTGSRNLKVTKGNITINLRDGQNKDPRITINGRNEVSLTFSGIGAVAVVYREGSL